MSPIFLLLSNSGFQPTIPDVAGPSILPEAEVPGSGTAEPAVVPAGPSDRELIGTGSLNWAETGLGPSVLPRAAIMPEVEVGSTPGEILRLAPSIPAAVSGAQFALNVLIDSIAAERFRLLEERNNLTEAMSSFQKCLGIAKRDFDR